MKQHEMILSEMSLEDKIGQMFMIGFKDLTLTQAVKDFINEKNIGFIDIFARNVTNIEQITELLNDVHQQGKTPPMIFTDQEGGVVCQFSELTSTCPSPMGLAAAGNTAFTELAAEILAEDMDLIGMDGFIAPTMDVNHEPDNPIIGLRSFSDDAETVKQQGQAFIRGISQIGLATIPKHFPGHGGSRLDSHLVLPSMDFSSEFFYSCDMLPFKAVAKDADFFMTAHISIPHIDSTGKPATFSSKFLTDILRKEFGFNGVLVTDCLEMDVVKNNFDPEEIIVNSIKAGIDVMLLSHSIDLQKELYDILLNKVKTGVFSEERINESVNRILAAKAKYNSLTTRKERDVKTAVKSIRKRRDMEDYISKHTIVMLRNKLNKIPLNCHQNIGIIEWEKTRSTIQLHEPTHTSYLEKFARKYFDKVDVLILPLKKSTSSAISEFLESHDNVIVAPFSRTPEVEMLQADMIRKILEMREDVIIIATGNPYDIRHFQDAKTYLVTFGFRDTQLKALFENITGKFKPQGKLPVEITGIFPRWYRSDSNA